MQTAQLTSGCKVNLFLRVGEKLPSGYHNLETLFVPLNQPCDTLTVSNQGHGFTLTCNSPSVNLAKNTLSKVFDLYSKERPLSTGLRVDLTKKVPIGGGLGGGSANAAVLLKHMQSLPAENDAPPLPQGKLNNIATAVGADVPFFLTEGCEW